MRTKKKGRRKEKKEAGKGLMGEKIEGLWLRVYLTIATGKKMVRCSCAFVPFFLFYLSKRYPHEKF